MSTKRFGKAINEIAFVKYPKFFILSTSKLKSTKSNALKGLKFEKDPKVT